MNSYRITLRCAAGLVLLAALGAAPAEGQPGSLDLSFGTGGIVRSSFPGNSSGRDVALQQDGKIVVAGSHVERYHSDGTLDTGFGDGGRAPNYRTAQEDDWKGLAIQNDGKIVVTGSASRNDRPVQMLARYDTDGSPDLSFGGSGFVQIMLPGWFMSGEDAALQEDGKIVVAGVGSDGTRNAMVVARYNGDGTLDTGFGNGGIAVVASEPYCLFWERANAIVVQQDGRIVVAGEGCLPAGSDLPQQFKLARFEPDGSPDASFGNGGSVVHTVSPGTSWVSKIMVHGDGLVAVGTTLGAGVANPFAFALIRCEDDGSLDPGFGTGGIVITGDWIDYDVYEPDESWVTAEGAAVLQDGRIVAVGAINYPNMGSMNDVALARYLPDGTLDASFGGGRVLGDLGSEYEMARAVAVQADGKLIVAGHSMNKLVLARYHTAEAAYTCPLSMQTVPGVEQEQYEQGETLTAFVVPVVDDMGPNPSLPPECDLHHLSWQLGTQSGQIPLSGNGGETVSFDIVVTEGDLFQEIVVTLVNRQGDSIQRTIGFQVIEREPPFVVRYTPSALNLTLPRGEAATFTVEADDAHSGISAFYWVVQSGGADLHSEQHPGTPQGEAFPDAFTYRFEAAGSYDVTVSFEDGFQNHPDQGVPTWHVTVQAGICDGVTQIPPAECEALVALYEATDGPNWSSRSGWMVTKTPCSWAGIQCAEGHVTWLSRVASGLKGSLPAALGDLAYLGTLYLSRNELSGGIPPELGRLSRLWSLDLSENGLTGPIPPELGTLSGLALRLDLSDNQLTGSIPPSLGNLPDLVTLDLSANRLTGGIPPELGSLPKLGILKLGANQLTGAIPSALAGLSLSILELQSNQLTGGIPTWLDSLARLTTLNLGDNRLTGAIPPVLGDLSALVSLNLGRNQLSGGIPSELGRARALGTLVLGSNQLTGPIPSPLAALVSLRTLDLSDNALEGSLPLFLINMKMMYAFSFQNTGLCVPADAVLQAWLAGIHTVQGSGLACAPGEPSLPCVQAVVRITAFDADQGASDTREWVRISHDEQEPVSFSGCHLAAVLGSADRSTFTTPLYGVVGPGETLLVGNAAVAEVDVLLPDNTLHDARSALYVLKAPMPPGTRPTAVASSLLAGVSYRSESQWYSQYPAPAAAKQGMGQPAAVEGLIASLAEMEAEEEVPEAYALSQNYPNPFNPQTTIRFALPEAVPVELVVYDVRGREVARLVSGVREAGRHEVTWDGRDAAGAALPSGLYLLRLQAGGFTASHPMTLVR